jgi:hypothetical protein
LHSVIAALIALIASTLTISIAYSLIIFLGVDKEFIKPLAIEPNLPFRLLSGIIIAPALETLLIVWCAEFLLGKRISSLQASLVISFFAGLVHSLV